MTPQEYLNTFTNFETQLNHLSANDFDLSRVLELLASLGDPQKTLNVVHVAGTKGKGSTCAFVSHALAADGKRVGLYTSPHLYRLNERIRVLDQGALRAGDDFYGMVSDEQLGQVINALRPHIAAMVNRGLFLTYFEVLTVAALVFFSQQNLDWVVLEAGLGGRLDATNVTESKVAVITPISLDHTKILGKTIAAIAVEKAGIIKHSRQQVVVAPQEPEALEVILKRCREFGIHPVVVDAAAKGKFKIPLKGRHQQSNALTAAAAIEALAHVGYTVDVAVVAKGFKNTRWPGRFELVQDHPLIIADGAHNQASALALARTVSEIYPEHKVILVLGILSDKDVAAVAEELRGMAEKVVLTKPAHTRAHVFSMEEAERLFQPKTWFMVDTVAEAMELAVGKASPGHVVLVTGSLFTVVEAKSWTVSRKSVAIS